MKPPAQRREYLIYFSTFPSGKDCAKSKKSLFSSSLYQPANILVKKDYTLKLIDYGCARRIKNDTGDLVDAIGVTEFAGTRMNSLL